MNSKTKLATGIMFFFSMWFGLQAWLTQTGIHASSALAFNTERYIIAALVMGGICLVTRAKFTKRAVSGGFAVGLVFAIMIGMESQALGHGSAGRVTFLGSLFVAVMPFLARFTSSEKLEPTAIIGSIIMLVGAWQLLFVSDGSSAGDGYGLLRAVTCAIMIVLIGRYAGEDWRVSTFVNVTVIAIMSFIGAILTGQTQFSLHPDVLSPVLISALVGSVGGVAFMTWCRRHLSSSASGVLYFLDSPFSVIWGVLLFGEALSPESLGAYMLIGIGAVCALTAGTLRLPQINLRLVERLAISKSPSLSLD
jgi:drug/metabolite transporter (DMT)-like permease